MNFERTLLRTAGPMPSVDQGATFVPARHYHRGRTRRVRLIVVHTMEYPERANGAEWCAQYFAGSAAPQASAHWAIDNDSTVQMVRETDTAWAAPGANADGIQLEHAGYAGQGVRGWQDFYSQAMLTRSASLAAGIVTRWGIPVRLLSNQQLRRGYAGFIGHTQASAVYRLSDHTDPGPTFPWVHYLGLVKNAVAGSPSSGPCPQPEPGPLDPPGRFPLPAGHWYGPDDGTIRSHSGKRPADRYAISVIQRKVGVAADGVFGPATQRAVSAWQKAHRLKPDGIVGPATWAAM